MWECVCVSIGAPDSRRRYRISQSWRYRWWYPAWHGCWELNSTALLNAKIPWGWTRLSEQGGLWFCLGYCLRSVNLTGVYFFPHMLWLTCLTWNMHLFFWPVGIQEVFFGLCQLTSGQGCWFSSRDTDGCLRGKLLWWSSLGTGKNICIWVEVCFSRIVV